VLRLAGFLTEEAELGTLKRIQDSLACHSGDGDTDLHYALEQEQEQEQQQVLLYPPLS
jgi:hypothetical protein